ncbi:MAG: hypothetical protein ACRBBV_10065 [Paracoccaceae bacterium]
MITQQEIDELSDQISQAMDHKLGLRRGTLARRLRRAGRRLPKRVRQHIQRLIEAQKISGNQHLIHQVDANALRAGQAESLSYINSIDPRDRRIGAMLGIAGGLVFNLILLVLALTAIWLVAHR